MSSCVKGRGAGMRFFGTIAKTMWPLRRQAWITLHHCRAGTHDPNNPHAPSSTPSPSVGLFFSSRATHEASNKSPNSRSLHITTPPPCQAERYSRRTRTSPRRSMSLFQRPRSWAQYVRHCMKLGEANTMITGQPASRHRPAACPREEDPPGTQAPDVHTYDHLLII
jgi:hypothetical protein